MTFEQHSVPGVMSFSAKNTYTECPERYRLEKVYRVPSPPGWWNVGGSAFHLVTEHEDKRLFDPSVPSLTFEEAFEIELQEVLGEEWQEEDLRAANSKREDKGFWLRNGPTYVERYLAWRDQAPYDILDTDAGPAIELPVTLTLPSGTEWTGYIDRIVRSRVDGSLIILDLKSGKNKPATTDQLVDYAVAAEQVLGEKIPWGTFYDARSGTTSGLVPTARGSLEKMGYTYGLFEYQRNQGLWLPNRRKDCAWCPVRDFCWAAGGGRANEIPRPWEMAPLAVRGEEYDDPDEITEQQGD